MSKLTEVRLERPTPADAKEWALLFAQAFVDTYPNEEFGISRNWCIAKAGDFTTPEAIADRSRRIAYGLTNPDKFLLIARVSGRLAGGLEGYSASDTGHQELQAVYVRPTGRGIGTALTDSFIDWVSARGLHTPVELEAVAYNTDAKRFYERYNFQEMPGHSHLLHGVLPVTRMRREP